MSYVAKRVKPGVPIWNIFAHGQDVGTATVFDYEGEGPMATVHYSFDVVTFTGSSIHEVLSQVGVYFRAIDADIKAQSDAEYYAEVIGPMQAAEAAAESYYLDEDPIWN